VRCSCASRALYTEPMPPMPRTASMEYRPASVVPGVKAIGIRVCLTSATGLSRVCYTRMSRKSASSPVNQSRSTFS
jgi:hypothetical protein